MSIHLSPWHFIVAVSLELLSSVPFTVLLLFTEPEGYVFGAANGLGLAVWRITAAAAAAADDDDAMTDSSGSDADTDRIAFGFMTWQSNSTLLHYASESIGNTLEVKLVSFSDWSGRKARLRELGV